MSRCFNSNNTVKGFQYLLLDALSCLVSHLIFMICLVVFQDEFLQDLVNFLESRGHNRLVPPAGLEAFPEVVLNGKRLDLYNLYKEVS